MGVPSNEEIVALRWAAWAGPAGSVTATTATERHCASHIPHIAG